MDRKYIQDDYYTRKFAGFLLTTTLVVALLFALKTQYLDSKWAEYSMYVLGGLISLTILTCGIIIPVWQSNPKGC
jgi:hypothetical protein